MEVILRVVFPESPLQPLGKRDVTMSSSERALPEKSPTSGENTASSPQSTNLSSATTAFPVTGKIETHVPSIARRFPWLIPAGAIAFALIAVWYLGPWAVRSLNTISTDDAYVDGHVTFVAPRVAGQVLRVLVDDNMRVKRGDLLVEIDPEPFRVQVAIKRALVDVAESDLVAARTQVEAYVGQARSAKFTLLHAIENVQNQIALLRSNMAQLKVAEATFTLADRDFERNKQLLEKNVITQADFDSFMAKRDETRSRVDSASEVVQETRASLGLPINKENPLDVPADLPQTFSLVRESLANLLQAAALFGYKPRSWDLTPDQAVAEFYQLDAKGDIDRIYA
ncbi:MAG: hypothetical protein C0478_03250 [Planctomyces sp.]|nr:hypothetical protein [Planctomyces sp.]